MQHRKNHLTSEHDRNHHEREEGGQEGSGGGQVDREQTYQLEALSYLCHGKEEHHKSEADKDRFHSSPLMVVRVLHGTRHSLLEDEN